MSQQKRHKISDTRTKVKYSSRSSRSYVDTLPIETIIYIYGYDPTYPTIMEEVFQEIEELYLPTRLVEEFNITFGIAKQIATMQRQMEPHEDILDFIIDNAEDGYDEDDNVVFLPGMIELHRYCCAVVDAHDDLSFLLTWMDESD